MTAKVLVVDDDPNIREYVRLALSDEGYDVAEATNGAEALAFVQGQDPCLILLDMRMPVMDGWRFASAYRALPGRDAPVVCMTAATDAAQRCREIAAERALGKPFDLIDLLGVVEQYCCTAG